ncbi:DNA mismatch repair endonuclease MutL [Candidatus Protochlamydia phocaeensis]|uniref:DNA mismatch repair endonuclease MutL n=1 Tax=Candidatus Protochlamydia phocaeensis TaxID=1414722 RepID=UPI000837D4F6|nr:DNA mismatch repair endonuclease MutL [Candidatus Protochlamydia phocaeensis]
MTTTSKISILNEQTINKIAAGEVIENPSSVVKELVENSLDAGATEICVEIQGGGRQLIRISDNGCGMSPEDALLCLERHATSKIKEVEDIQDLLTMGFRGEAIPSIAAISKFSLLTCPRLENKQTEGTLVSVEGGKLISSSPAARAPGTTMEVRSLFYNVPVRRKFQKSPSYDAQEILKILSALALGHPSVQFELISDQKSLFKTPLLPAHYTFQESLNKRIETLLGKEFASSLCPLHFEQAPYELKGFIGTPSHHKANRTGQYLFINQRAVYSPFIASAIREGYGTMLGTNRYPVFVLHLHLPGTFLDVNVHPQKKEVRLRQEHLLKTALIEAVQKALRQDQPSFLTLNKEPDRPFPSLSAPYASLLPPPFFQTKKELYVEEEENWEYKANPSYIPPSPSLPPLSSPALPVLPTSPLSSLETPPSVLEPVLQFRTKPTDADPAPFLFDALSEKPAFPTVLTTLVGYIMLDPFSLTTNHCPSLVQKERGGLCLIDQKAAYARICYERLLKQSASQPLPIQHLLVPATMQFSAPEAALLKDHLALLNEMGFSIREFGEHTFVLDAFPAFFQKEHPEAWLSAIVHDLADKQDMRQLQRKKEEQLALAASRASLSSTKRLSHEEAQGLVDQLFACDLPFQCPFGKSTLLYLAPGELAAYFT